MFARAALKASIVADDGDQLQHTTCSSYLSSLTMGEQASDLRSPARTAPGKPRLDCLSKRLKVSSFVGDHSYLLKSAARWHSFSLFSEMRFSSKQSSCSAVLLSTCIMPVLQVYIHRICSLIRYRLSLSMIIGS
jgi:hypothetical protein